MRRRLDEVNEGCCRDSLWRHVSAEHDDTFCMSRNLRSLNPFIGSSGLFDHHLIYRNISSEEANLPKSRVPT